MNQKNLHIILMISMLVLISACREDGKKPNNSYENCEKSVIEKVLTSLTNTEQIAKNFDEFIEVKDDHPKALNFIFSLAQDEKFLKELGFKNIEEIKKNTQAFSSKSLREAAKTEPQMLFNSMIEAVLLENYMFSELNTHLRNAKIVKKSPSSVRLRKLEEKRKEVDVIISESANTWASLKLKIVNSPYLKIDDAQTVLSDWVSEHVFTYSSSIISERLIQSDRILNELRK